MSRPEKKDQKARREQKVNSPVRDEIFGGAEGRDCDGAVTIFVIPSVGGIVSRLAQLHHAVGHLDHLVLELVLVAQRRIARPAAHQQNRIIISTRPMVPVKMKREKGLFLFTWQDK